MAVRTSPLIFSRMFAGVDSANAGFRAACIDSTSRAENRLGSSRYPSRSNRRICSALSFIGFSHGPLSPFHRGAGDDPDLRCAKRLYAGLRPAEDQRMDVVGPFVGV